MISNGSSLKITLCARNFSMQGGAERFFFNLTQHLKKRGHQVKVITLKAVATDGVAVEVIRKPAHVTRAYRDWIYGARLAAAVSKEDCDVSFGEQKTWHCNVIRPGGGVEDEYWKTHLRYQFPGVTLPEGLRSMHLKRQFDLAAERRGYSSPNFRHVVANSDMIRRQLLVHYPRLEDRISVVYNGVELERFNPDNRQKWRKNVITSLALDEEAPVAIFIGYDYRRKGLKQALETIAKLASSHDGHPMQLLVVGGHRSRPYEELTEKLGISRLVRFVGSTTRPEEYYASSDVLLLPSYYDACANVVLEALGSGLPVLTTAANGGSDLLTDGLNGWVLEDPNNIDGMVNHLRELYNPERRGAMSREAVELAEKHPVESKLAAVADVLERVADGNRRVARERK